MKKNTKKIPVTRATYIKTLLFFTIFSLFAYLIIPQISYQRLQKPENEKGDTQIDENQVRIHVKNALYDRYLQFARDIIDELKPVSITEQNLKRAIAGNRTVSAVAVWPKNARWPVRFVNPELWEQSYVSELADAETQELYDFIFIKNYTVKPAGTLYTGKIWRNGPHVLISIGFVAKTNKIDALELKIEPYFNNMMRKFFDGRTKVFIVDSAGNVLYAKGGAFNSELFSNEAYRTISVPELSLTILYDWKSLTRSVKTNQYRGLFSGLLFLLLPIISLLLAMSIDKPLINLSREVTDIGRGDFSHVLPPYKNRHIDKIGRICNYMSQEMDKMRNFDIKSIIKEKHKTDAIIDYIPDGVVVTDMQDRIIRINQRAEHWFAAGGHTSKGRNIDEYIESSIVKGLLKKIREGAPHGICEFCHNRQWFEAHSSRVIDESGALNSVVTVFRDVTKIKEADKIKEELVSMVSHELKSPLSAIYGFSELMAELELSNKEALEYTKIISVEATRLTDLVNKFLDISRLESGRTTLHRSIFSINAIVVKAIDTLKPVMDKKNMRVVINIDTSVPDVWGDIDMIEQLLINLLSNAVEYSPGKSKIGIEASKDGDYLWISVVDNGYGIPEESMDKIFDKFFRVTGSDDSGKSEGTGLGLALSKEIVASHNGKIKVKSKLGVGSVFSFSIPIADTQVHE